MLKKILIGVGALFALLLVAIIAVPFFVDVDKYRPQIVMVANDKINGKLEIGKLALSLWGQVRVKIDGVKITDPKGQEVLGVKDAFFHIPFSSILTGSPSLILVAERPMILAIKNKQGKLNLMSLMKTTPGGAQPPAGGAAQPPAAGGGASMAVPGIVARSRLGIEMLHAKVTYKDQTTDLSTEFPDMNLVIKDLSLTRTAEIKFWTDIDTKLGKTFALKGPIKLNGQATPKLTDNKFDNVSLTMKLDLDDTDMRSGDLFHKAKGVPCNVDLALTASAKEARIEKANARFHNAEIMSSGVISNLGAAPAAEGQPAPSMVVHFQAKSNAIEFKSWSELIPMLKEYELGGSAKFDASADGPADKLGYKAEFYVQKLTAKAGKLKAQPVFNASLKVTTDKVDRFILDMKAPGNDLNVSGSVASFTAPRVTAQVTSNGMDLDQLIEFPPPGAKTAAAPEAAGGGGGAGAGAGGGKAAAADYDAMLAPLRENPMMAAMNATLTTDIKFIKAYNVKIDGIGAKVTFKDLTAALEGFKMRVFGGGIKSDFSVALRPKQPTYKFSAGVDGLVLQQAVESQLALFKNTILGTANFSMNGTGASFNPDPAIANLNAKGNMKVDKATFASIDIGKMVTEALNSSIAKVAEKIPTLKGKGIKGMGTGSSRYEFISSDFSIAGGKFSAPNFTAKAEKNAGIDIAGATTVGLKAPYPISADWKVVDTYNMTHAKDLSAPGPAGEVPHVLAKGNDPVQFPIHVGGTAEKPEYSYSELPGHFASVVASNMAGAATGRAKSEAQKQIQKAIPAAPPVVQDKLKGLGKKLFGG